MRLVRVVFYLRMSTDRQETSIGDQRAALVAHAKAKGYKVIGEYVDEGISGDATEKRVAFQRMVADSGKKLFELILCWDQDRFGRFDPLEGGYWIKPIRDAGVQLETLSQGRIDWSDFASRLVWTVTQEAKHAYLRTLARDCARGLKSAAENGVYPGKAPFGFAKKNKRLVLGPDDEVETVREIFRLKLSGMGYRTISNLLRDRGTKAPGRGKWTSNQVRYIVKRACYKGTLVYGKKATRGKYANIGGVITIEDNHPAIVDKATWDAVQETYRNNTVKYRRSKLVGPLAGLMKCGECGSVMYRWRSKSLYVCGRYHRGEGCGCRQIREDEALQIIADEIRCSVGEDAQKLAKRIAKARGSQDGDAAIRSLQRRLADLERQVQRAAQRLMTVDEDVFQFAKSKLDELRVAKAKAERELDAQKPAENDDPLEVAKQLVALPRLIFTEPPEKVHRLLSAAIYSLTVHCRLVRSNIRQHFELKDLEIKLRH